VHFLSFWALPAVAAAALALTWPDGDAGLFRLLWVVPAALVVWTLIEYVFHRFVFHLGSDKFHYAHHDAPTDRTFLLVRFPYVAAVSLALVALLMLLTGDAFTTTGFMCGIWAGFLMYEFVHYSVHLSSKHGRWMSGRRRVHFDHHFRNPKRHFGVTTSLWDFVFRTF
jgi:hypothetical protein